MNKKTKQNPRFARIKKQIIFINCADWS